MQEIVLIIVNHISDVLISVLASSAVDHGFKLKTIKFVFVASPLSMKHQGERAKSGWLRIRIMCQSGVTLFICRLVSVS